MSLQITNTLISSKVTAHRATRGEGNSDRWVVSWCPDHSWNSLEAVTAMCLAEVVTPWARDPRRLRWSQARMLAAELRIDLDTAVEQILRPAPGTAGEDQR